MPKDTKPYHSIVELKTMSILFKSTKRFKESETQASEVVNKSMRTSMKNTANETSLRDHDSQSRPFGNTQQNLKLQLLDSSVASAGRENFEDGKPSEVRLKKEYTTETETMEIHVFQGKNQLCGMTSSPLKQVSELDQNAPTHLAPDCPKKEVRHKNHNTKVPDINLQPPAETDISEPTTSTTQSLDLRSLPGHNEQPSSLKSNFYPAVLLEQEMDSRWVKRLKLSASGSFSAGTKSSNLASNSSHEKANKFLSKLTKATIADSALRCGKLHSEELMAHDRTPALTRNSNFSFINIMNKNQELLTSQFWTRRLLHNRAATAQKRPQPVAFCEPQGSKPDELQKWQIPSVGAMALMAKAMTGFQPREFQKRGPYVVWNTEVSETT